jgi:hypothetical protein
MYRLTYEGRTLRIRLISATLPPERCDAPATSNFFADVFNNINKN